MDNTRHKPFCLEVWGDYACFTRPEMKVERVSYDVPTPSATRAIFEAIFWKPAIRWQINRIEVLNPIKWISVRRNELGVVMSPRSDGVSIEDNRQQRAGLLLRDVHYRFYATLLFIPAELRSKPTAMADKRRNIASEEGGEAETELSWEIDNIENESREESPGKYLAIFKRRAIKGQHFTQPYLGCREFSCHYKLMENGSELLEPPIPETREFGYMLYDMDFSNPDQPHAMFFRAKLENGVVHVPALESEEVRR